MHRPGSLALAVLVACGAPSPVDSRTQGVQIFAADTVTARIHVSIRGDMQVSLRGDEFQMRPDRTFLVTTPATLEVTRGIGTAIITSTDSTTRIAVLPIGTPEDSIDAETVTGTVVRFTRLGYDRRMQRLVRNRP